MSLRSQARQRYETNVSTYRDSVKRVRGIFDEFVSAHEFVRVLDAGCGSASYLQLSSRCHVTGIDVSLKQLERNDRLDEWIQGDLETTDLGLARFDVVVCWDVLEHLRAPSNALARLLLAVSSGGLFVVASPYPSSWKGAIARVTPHAFHRWLYKVFFNWQEASDSEGPFPVFMRRAGGPEAVTRLGNARARRRVRHAQLAVRNQDAAPSSRRSYRLLRNQA